MIPTVSHGVLHRIKHSFLSASFSFFSRSSSKEHRKQKQKLQNTAPYRCAGLEKKVLHLLHCRQHDRANPWHKPEMPFNCVTTLDKPWNALRCTTACNKHWSTLHGILPYYRPWYLLTQTPCIALLLYHLWPKIWKALRCVTTPDKHWNALHCIATRDGKRKVSQVIHVQLLRPPPGEKIKHPRVLWIALPPLIKLKCFSLYVLPRHARCDARWTRTRMGRSVLQSSSRGSRRTRRR